MRSKTTLMALLVLAIAAVAHWLTRGPPFAVLTSTVDQPAAVDAPPAASAGSSQVASASPSSPRSPNAPSHPVTPTTSASATLPVPASAAAPIAKPEPIALDRPLTLAELERRARDGDAKAARELAEALSDCGAVISSNSVRSVAAQSAFSGSEDPIALQRLRESFLGARAAECRARFSDPDPEVNRRMWYAAVEEAWARAAARGDRFALMMEPLMSPTSWPPSAATLNALRDRALAHVDLRQPRSLVEVGVFADLLSRYSNSTAWRLVACDLGYDCAANGELAHTMCLSQSDCFSVGYEQYLLERLPPREWEAVQRQRQLLLRDLRAGNFAGALEGPPGGG